MLRVDGRPARDIYLIIYGEGVCDVRDIVVIISLDRKDWWELHLDVYSLGALLTFIQWVREMFMGPVAPEDDYSGLKHVIFEQVVDPNPAPAAAPAATPQAAAAPPAAATPARLDDDGDVDFTAADVAANAALPLPPSPPYPRRRPTRATFPDWLKDALARPLPAGATRPSSTLHRCIINGSIYWVDGNGHCFPSAAGLPTGLRPMRVREDMYEDCEGDEAARRVLFEGGVVPEGEAWTRFSDFAKEPYWMDDATFGERLARRYERTSVFTDASADELRYNMISAIGPPSSSARSLAKSRNDVALLASICKQHPPIIRLKPCGSTRPLQRGCTTARRKMPFPSLPTHFVFLSAGNPAASAAYVCEGAPCPPSA